jgi:hypothetical protein
MAGTTLNLLSLNLGWQTSRAGRDRQCAAVDQGLEELGGGPAVLALQETKPASVKRFETDGWDVLAHNHAPRGRLGVAILGRDVEADGEPLRQDADYFTVGEVYPDLAAWFAERAVAVAVQLNGVRFTYGSFHATPGSSDGPRKQGVGGARKPWFHRRVAEWVATWPRPYGFAIDANSPDEESLDAAKFFIRAGTRCEAGEDDLLAVRGADPGRPLHDAEDLLRVWLRTDSGADRLAEIAAKGEGPLWISHYTRGGKPKRFDHIWATNEVDPKVVRYWSPTLPAAPDAISDHAVVAVNAVIRSP